MRTEQLRSVFAGRLLPPCQGVSLAARGALKLVTSQVLLRFKLQDTCLHQFLHKLIFEAVANQPLIRNAVRRPHCLNKKCCATSTLPEMKCSFRFSQQAADIHAALPKHS